MPTYRETIEELVLTTVEDILPDGKNRAMYKEAFSNMNDEQFDQWVESLKQGGSVHLVCPANQETKLNVENNIKIAKRFDYDFFQPLKLTDADTDITYDTPNSYIMVHLPFRRAIQTLQNKVSIPKNLSHVDQRTDQATGASKGSRISMPESQIMNAQGLVNAPIEFLKYRGGDSRAFNAMNQLIIKTGGVSQTALDRLNTRPKSTEVLSIFFKAAHINNNL